MEEQIGMRIILNQERKEVHDGRQNPWGGRVSLIKKERKCLTEGRTHREEGYLESRKKGSVVGRKNR